MAGGGSKPGERRGGRQKGTSNKATIRKRLLLASVEEQFRGKEYDPLAEMIAIAEKPRPSLMDQIRFDFSHETSQEILSRCSGHESFGGPRRASANAGVAHLVQ